MGEKLTSSDLGFLEDAINILINLVHLEVHTVRSYNNTKDLTWLKVNNQARIERTELLEKICDKKLLESDGDLWCINKHSLVVMGGYIELGNREYTKGNLEEAIKYYEKFSQWLGIFLIKNKLTGGKK